MGRRYALTKISFRASAATSKYLLHLLHTCLADNVRSRLDEDTYHWHVHSILSGWLTPELRDAEKEFGKYPDAAIKILQYVRMPYMLLSLTDPAS